jgi:predicted RNase H-like HicB family nuclease
MREAIAQHVASLLAHGEPVPQISVAHVGNRAEFPAEM